jgi:hypothetical protein
MTFFDLFKLSKSKTANRNRFPAAKLSLEASRSKPALGKPIEWNSNLDKRKPTVVMTRANQRNKVPKMRHSRKLANH